MTLTSLAFVLAFSIGALLALARHPLFGLLTYIGVFYLSPADRWWGVGLLEGVRWSLLAAAVTMVSILVHRAKLHSDPFWRQPPVVGLLLFTMWLGIQSFWAMDREAHMLLLTMYMKFVIALLMFVRCVDSIRSLKLVLWAHVLGCFYFGWIAFTKHAGGRFEGFGGPGLDDANSGALALATGVLVAASLFIVGRLKERISLVLIMPLILNGLVATISRSGFLAIAVGGVIFNLFAPKRVLRIVRILSVLGLVLMFLVTNPNYWTRMGTIKYAGQELENVDTGAGRMETVQAQFRMFRQHPLGCGHRCTAVLSPYYLDERFLSEGARSSHNTFMSLLVEQGVPGGLFYLVMLLWLYRSLRKLRSEYRNTGGTEAGLFPAVFAVLAAITAGDQFVDYLKFEIRIWFIAIVMILLAMAMRARGTQEDATGSHGPAASPNDKAS